MNKQLLEYIEASKCPSEEEEEGEEEEENYDEDENEEANYVGFY